MTLPLAATAIRDFRTKWSVDAARAFFDSTEKECHWPPTQAKKHR
jgi:hypothetical protein